MTTKIAVVGTYRSYRNWCYLNPRLAPDAVFVNCAERVRGYHIRQTVVLHDAPADVELWFAIEIAERAAKYG